VRLILACAKLTVFVGCTLGLYALWYVGDHLATDRTGWRQTIFYYWTVSFVRLSGMKIEIIGTPPVPPFFLVANHLGYADIAALRVCTKGVFVAKAEVSGWPVAGRIVRDMGTVFIDRTRRRDIPRAGQEILVRLRAGEGIIVFPEGTSTKGEEVLPFNSSFLEFAARGDIAISYATITYETEPRELPASIAICWWEDISFFRHLFRLFRLRGFKAIIHFGNEAIVSHDRKQLAAELHRRVYDNFVPVR
jgi:1-acyl-sn-glycerol-3-phosphate acyltransferase